MPTGWRPADVAEKYPVKIIEDPYAYKKYYPSLTGGLQLWSWIQWIFAFASMLFMFNTLHLNTLSHSLLYGAHLLLSIVSFTMLMDKHRWSLTIEALRFISALVIIFQLGGWFLIDSVLPNGTFFVVAYFTLSLVATIWFYYKEVKSDQELANVSFD